MTAQRDKFRGILFAAREDTDHSGRLSQLVAGFQPRPDIRAPTASLRPAKLSGVEVVFSITQVIISVVLVALVLMHSGKDAGLSGAFGVGTGAGPLGGGSLVERNLNRWTVVFAVLFFLNAILLLKHPWS